VSRQRSSVPDPGHPAWPVSETDGGGANQESLGTRGDEVEALVTLAEKHVSLGLPVGPSERFRFVKRLVSRICWVFLRHQVAFNRATIDAIRALSEQVGRLEQNMKDDLLDFADRSVSQAHAEISDQVADARSTNAELILELRTLQAELDAVVKEVAVALPREQGRAGLAEGRDITRSSDGAPESQR
jgi:hypothetical protein